MSISINALACTGCGSCTGACPGNLLVLGEDGKARIRDVRDCWGCTACLKACRAHAISYFLGADIGGRGTTLAVEGTGSLKTWTFTRHDGSVERIQVDAGQANKY